MTHTTTGIRTTTFAGATAIAIAIGLAGQAFGVIPGLAPTSSRSILTTYNSCLSGCAASTGDCSTMEPGAAERCAAAQLQCRLQCDARLEVMEAGEVRALPAGQVDAAYSYILLQPYDANVRIDLVDGALPAGMNLVRDRLTGTPLRASSYGFTVRFMSGRDVVTRKYSLTVNPAPEGWAPATSGGMVPSTHVPSTDTRTTDGGTVPSRETPSSGGSAPVLTHVPSTDTRTTDVRTTETPSRETPSTVSADAGTRTPVREVPTSSGSGSSALVVTHSPPRDAATGSGTTGSSGSGSAVVTGSQPRTASTQTAAETSATITATPPRTAPVMSMSIATERLPDARVGQPYQSQVATEASGGAVVTFSATGLPDGLRMGTSGSVVGTPTTAGEPTVTVTAVAKWPSLAGVADVTTRRAIPIRVNAAIVATEILTASLPRGTVGASYAVQLQAQSGASVVWSAQGSLPPGLALSSAGILSGTPSQAGEYAVSVTAKAAGADLVSRTLVLGVDAAVSANPGSVAQVPPLAFIPRGGYPDAFVGYYYNAQPFEVTGGQPPYRFAVVSGSLTSGLALQSWGGIAGVPTVAESRNFTLEVKDARGTSVRLNTGLVVRPGQERIVISGGTNTVYVSQDPGLAGRQQRIRALGLFPHDLVKLQDDGHPETQYDSTVYYIGTDGRRHAFPNQRVYFTWFPNYDRVRIVGPQGMADVPLGANVTYRPGSRLVKFVSDSRVYAVDKDRTLRWVVFADVAAGLYGSSWASMVDDLSEAFFSDYRIGDPIGSASAFSPRNLLEKYIYPSDVMPQ